MLILLKLIPSGDRRKRSTTTAVSTWLVHLELPQFSGDSFRSSTLLCTFYSHPQNQVRRVPAFSPSFSQKWTGYWISKVIKTCKSCRPEPKLHTFTSYSKVWSKLNSKLCFLQLQDCMDTNKLPREPASKEIWFWFAWFSPPSPVRSGCAGDRLGLQWWSCWLDFLQLTHSGSLFPL